MLLTKMNTKFFILKYKRFDYMRSNRDMKMYDYLIVGSGLYGSIFAREATNKGYKCLVIDKRGNVGGNIYTEKVEGINVHKYGAHIFNTNNQKVWD